MKYCKDCKTTKPLEEYYKCGNTVQTRCKSCHNVYRNTCKRTYVPVVYKTPFEKLDDHTQSVFKEK